jgi:hypothetical protein
MPRLRTQVITSPLSQSVMSNKRRALTDELPAPGFGRHDRIRLLLSDLLVFDARRLGWRLAIPHQ